MKKPAPKSGRHSAPAPAMAHDPDMMKYRARDAIDTLKRAEEIKADKQLMAHVKQHAIEQRSHLNKVIRRKS